MGCLHVQKQCLIDIRYFNEHNYQGTKRRGEQKVRRQVHIFARLKTHCEREFGDMSSAHGLASCKSFNMTIINQICPSLTDRQQPAFNAWAMQGHL